MRRSVKGLTPLLVFFAAVLVIGMLFFSKQNVVSGFADKVAAPSKTKPYTNISSMLMPFGSKPVGAAPLRR